MNKFVGDDVEARAIIFYLPESEGTAGRKHRPKAKQTKQKRKRIRPSPFHRNR